MKLFFIFALLACFTPVTYSWGNEGHRTVGRIAQNFLTSDVNNQVNALLGPYRSLENASTWADTIKGNPLWQWSKELHYIDTHDDPPITCSVLGDDCKDGNCIVGAIANYTSQLDSSSGLSFTERSIALRFLTHFLGDITQPLHVCGRDLGGLKQHVIFEGRQSENLHGIWDSDIVRKRLDDFSGSIDAAIEAYAANLTSAIISGSYKDISSGWVSCIGGLKTTTQCPLQWAADSNALNCKIVWSYVLDNPGTDLDGEYYDSVVPYIDQQLARGGYMLGTLLNSLLSGTGSAVLQDYSI